MSTETTTPATDDDDTLDLATLATSAKPATVEVGPTRFANNPFVGPLRESFQRDQSGGNAWVSNRVKGTQVRALVAALRNAGTQLTPEGIGVHIKVSYRDDNNNLVSDSGDTQSVPKDARLVDVKWRGGKRREYTRRTASQPLRSVPTQTNGNGPAEFNGDVDPEDDGYQEDVNGDDEGTEQE